MSWWRRLLGRPPLAEHLRTGAWGERMAAKHLRRKGYKILARNVRFGNEGELDLVIRSRTTLVFIEVKTRKNEDFGRPGAAVDRGKTKALRRAARAYLKRLRAKPKHYRFDLVEVVGTPETGLREIRHLEGAITVER